MRNVGIVCEFDPFHNGHRYLLEEVRRCVASHIICSMSGDFTQRGSVALIDKQARAECAVKYGADLVFELPPPLSCACSEVFARANIRLLAAAGADTVAFGSEITDITLLNECADISEGLYDNEKIKELLASGLSYPSAVSGFIEQEYGRRYSGVFSLPNATLGIEYIKAARVYGIDEILPIKRRGAEHNSETIIGGVTSASNIRQLVKAGRDVSTLTPLDMKGEPKAYDENMAGHILFTLCTLTPEKLKACPDCSDILADRILKLARQKPSSPDELFARLKAKDITMARLKRVVLFLAAGLEDIKPDELTAARVLAFNDKGSQILKNAKQNSVLFTASLARVLDTCPKAAINTEKASYFRYLCTDRTSLPINEYSRQIKIYKEN